MFTVADRDRIRAALVDAARADERLSGVALTGSAAAGREDRWSDIDLAFGVAGPLGPVMADWTQRLNDLGAVDYLDMHAGPWVYRVFVFGSSLQVDLAFAPETDFGALAPTFRLLHGEAQPLPAAVPPPAVGYGRLAWLYALHARASVERGRLWQAEQMIAGVRERVLAMACLRHGLPAAHGKGIDELPETVTAPLRATLVGTLDEDGLRRALRAAVEALRAEIAHVDAALAERLAAPFAALTPS